MVTSSVTVVHYVHWKTLIPWLLVFLMGFVMLCGTLFVVGTGAVSVADKVTICKVVEEPK